MERAPNVRLVRARASGAIVRVLVTAVEDVQAPTDRASSVRFTYRETIAGHTITTLKRFDEASGCFVPWT
jgi:hypothetical protein